MKHLITVLFCLICSAAFAGQEEKAFRKAAEAAIKQFKIDKMAKRLEKRYIHEDVRVVGGYAISITRIITEQKVTYKWTF